MKNLAVAVGLFALLPIPAWAAPVVSSPAADVLPYSGSQSGLLFGGFFTLYSFAVASPLAPVATGADTLAPAVGAEPQVDSPPVQALVDVVELVDEGDDPPTTLPSKPALILVVSDTDAEPVIRLPVVAVADPVQEWGPVLLVGGAEVPEPSTLLLAALAALALLASRGATQRASSRRQ